MIWFNWIVYLQVPFWFFFYFRNGDRWARYASRFRLLWLGLILGFGVLYGIMGVRWISNYPMELVLYYASILFFTFEFIGDLPFPKRISLAFLITFFSSYFWETPLHIMDLLENGLTSRFIIQAVHLIPLAFFMMIYEVRDRKAIINRTLVAHMITLGIVILERSIDIIRPYWFPLGYLIRLSCFWLLIDIFTKKGILRLKKDSEILNIS